MNKYNDDNIPFFEGELTDEEHYKYDHYYDMSDYHEFGFLYETREENFKIDIKDKELFLALISKRLLGGRFIPNMKNDFKHIRKNKILTNDNTKELIKYLDNAHYCSTYYFDAIKDLIVNDRMDPDYAFSFLEDIKAENDYMMSVMCKYFSKLGERGDF